MDRLKVIVENTAESNGATAILEIRNGYPITFNDINLTAKMLPILKNVVEEQHVHLKFAVMGAEDFSFYQQKVPGFFFWLGGCPLETPNEEAPAHHTQSFFVDDIGMIYGVKAMSRLMVDYMEMK